MSPDRAAQRLSIAAGWSIPADWMDPFVIDVAYEAARARHAGDVDMLRRINVYMAICTNAVTA